MKWTYDKVINYVKELLQWLFWWFTYTILMVSSACGYVCLPIYQKVIMLIDMDFRVRKPCRVKWLRKNRYQFSSQYIILPLAAKLCVLTEALNVQSEHLAYLREPIPDAHNSYAGTMIDIWHGARRNFGYFPPHGWPLKLSYIIFGMLSVIVAIIEGHKRILKAKQKNKQIHQHRVYSTADKYSDMRSEVFDADSDTIVVDNSANCIIWRHKKILYSRHILN